MYTIANLAIGGSWPGAPDNTTVFLSYYDVDYIRIYERAADAGPGDGGAQDTGAPDAPAQDTGTQDAGAKESGPQNDAAAGDAGGTKDGGTSDGGAAASQPPADEDEGGCGCRSAGPSGASAAWLIALAGLVLRARARLQLR
jgi:MYXO-CTERM domain-containing protein